MSESYMTLEEATKRYLAIVDELSADDAFSLGHSIVMGILTAAKAQQELATCIARLVGSDGIVMLLVEKNHAIAQWATLVEKNTNPIPQTIVTEVAALVGDYLRTRVGKPLEAKETAKA